MAAELRSITHKNDPDPAVVEELERLLTMARSGELTAYFIFYRASDGPEMSRIGFTDSDACFSADVMKRRIMDGYK